LRTLLSCCALAGLAAPAAHADPWLAPGDLTLRHDIELLADAGVLRGPVTTWPLSWPDIARDVLAVSLHERHWSPITLAALSRVQRQARDASSVGLSTAVRAAVAHEPDTLRGFADTPREDGEVGLQASYLGDRIAFNARATAVVDPQDDKRVRPDGSYLGVSIGNFMISAGYMERWWGPGWDGSLILSTNARPIPSLTLERNYTDAFRSPWLSWIGPWRASIAVGQAEERGVEVGEVRFLAARVNFRPRPWLELGLTRTAQWCGTGRACGWRTFRDMLIGRDNRDATLSEVDEPGNQMAGYDARLRSPLRWLPVALYTQWIGEDEAGGLPSKFLGLLGAELWAPTGWGSLLLRGEYADTACTFTRELPDFDCAYRNAIYPQGYTYRGRIIGHAMDNDSRVTTLAALLMRSNGDSFSLTARQFDINRDGGAHSISPAPLEVDDVELRYSSEFDSGKIVIGLGNASRHSDGTSNSDLRGFVIWQQGF
jgi:hypothetical protein